VKRLYNLDHAPAVVDINKPAVFRHCGYDFTDEQVRAGITGLWSEEDPRAHIEQERAFKARRRAEADKTDPAEPEKE
jgi:hypothetical protein